MYNFQRRQTEEVSVKKKPRISTEMDDENELEKVYKIYF